MDFRKPIEIIFQIKCQDTKWGENLYLLGDNETLGKWNTKKAIKMNTDRTSFPIWFSKNIELIPRNSLLEYKYLIMNDSGKVIKWEEFQNNRKLDFNELTMNFKVEDILELNVKDTEFGKNPLNNNSVIDFFL
jgi:hypothetical protein